jgi:hypothetical protein
VPHDNRRSQASTFFELQGKPDARLRFARPDASAIAAIREVAAGQPIRPFIADVSGVDAWDQVSIVGDAQRMIDALATALRRDYESKVAELGAFCNLEILIAESNIHPDAVHVITMITPKDRLGESISYGARLQRLDVSRSALWSDY